MRLPNPYTLEETLSKLHYNLVATFNEEALALLGKALSKDLDDRNYAALLEEILLWGSTVEIRECLSCFCNYLECCRETEPYYPHHDAVNGIDSALYVILFGAVHPATELAYE